MKNIKLIVGLGNFGTQFLETRHNVGFWYLNELSNYLGITFNKERKFFSDIAKITLENQKIYLLKPRTYMNLSGFSVFSFSSFYKIKFSEILIIRDELDLLPGTIKLKINSGSNGHNGIKNILHFFKKDNIYMQICIGIGRPRFSKHISSFVLQKPNSIEKDLILISIKKFINKKNILYT